MTASRRHQAASGLDRPPRYGAHATSSARVAPAGRPVHPALLYAFGEVKLACARTNRALGAWADRPKIADAIERACGELAAGEHTDAIIVDALQGGAGTATNMNVNEVLAHRARELCGEGGADTASITVHPLDDLNLHQSTNDTYPTALRLAAIRGLRRLERSIVTLQEAFQRQEHALADVVKVGRTQLQDAVLTTLGRSMGAYAEALSRDRWRVYKCEERLRVVNLGGTAIGTGLGAPRQYIFRVVDTLREQTGVAFARAENLVEATQNADVFVEVSGMLKALAATLSKIAHDLRLLSSGPEAGFGELRLPTIAAGSSIMPGKINPVVPEAVAQLAMRVFGHDHALTLACASGNLELNPFLPLVADALLDSLDLLNRGCAMLAEHCVDGLEVDHERCASQVAGATAAATALAGRLGYDRAAELATQARAEGRSLREVALAAGALSADDYDALVSPEAVCRLGSDR
jgi:aspartate ammonia-lyase